ncbi:MAG: acetylxylan esterase [Tannerellaceae bacterium]|jgi:cephalosporin-C deacetylase-like acetyl esterase|nr:acetylxylan esterase [Tannerellaceae bacterium]
MEKKRFSWCIFILIGGIVAGCETPEDDSPTLHETFSNVWRFHAGTDSLWQDTTYDDTAWQEVSTDKTLADYNLKTEQGFGWYRKTINLPDALYKVVTSKGGIILHLDSLAGADTLYVNGNMAGWFSMEKIVENKFLERHYFVPAKYLNKGDNLLAMKFYDGWSPYGGGLLKGAQLSLTTAETADKLDMDVSVADSDYIFMAPAPLSISVSIENNNTWVVKGYFVVSITTDDFLPVRSDTLPVQMKAGQSYAQAFDFTDPSPGFYRYTVQFVHNGKVVQEKKFNIGFEPEKISSPIDAKADFKDFWDNNLKKLAKVKPEYKLTFISEQSNDDYSMYLVEMRSLGDKIIRGYYAQPTREGKFPVLVEYMGYGSSPHFPNTQWDGFAHYVPSIRGQALNRLTEEDDFWITIGLQDKEGYYYQGAYCDVVRAIDFVSSRPEIDADRIGVRGGSQGGALSFVAAALDKRVKVAAPSIPFLSDYRDYFKIAPWPKSDFDDYKQVHPEMDWEQVYDLLTYFDIKNLAQWISCPLIMSFGVQDNVCPPHINFAAYNQVMSEKLWVACPLSAHNTDARAWEAERKFIKSKLRVQ